MDQFVASSDGITWTSRTSGVGDNLYEIIYDGSQFVAVGDSGAITTSGDGIDMGNSNLRIDFLYLNGIGYWWKSICNSRKWWNNLTQVVMESHGQLEPQERLNIYEGNHLLMEVNL